MIDSTNIKQISENIRELDAEMKKSALPSVDSEDAGKGLIVSDEGEWVAGDLPSGLPEVETTDEGKVLTVSDEGEWVADDLPPSFALDYTTTPTKTGFKFANKDVYRVLIPYADTSDPVTVGSTMEFNAPTGIETPISAFYVFDGTGGNYGTIIQANQMRVNGGKCKVYVDSASFSGVPGNTFYLMLDYTITSSESKKKTKKG